MRDILIAAAVALGGLMAASAVQAMPMSGYEAKMAETPVTLVDYVCGRGWHEGDDGDCRPDYWRHGPPRGEWGGGPARYGWAGGPPRWHHHWDDGDDDGWRHPHPRW